MESHRRTTAFTSGQADPGGCRPSSLLYALVFVFVFVATEGRAESTVYVGKHFEVRDHDQPTKYVFNGGTRVARIIGSLSTNTRIQRIRLHPGWNLLSLAVSATNLSDQLQSPGVVTSAHSWNAQTGSYFPVPQVASSGLVLWVNAMTNATLSVVGAYADPVNREVSAGTTYLASTGLEAWTPALPPSVAAWSFTPQPSSFNSQAAWHARLTGDLSSVNDLPHTFPPGQALYVINPAPFELAIPDPALRVRYYHQDHLGSSSTMTDANGGLVEETAFYPFGIPRHEHRFRQVEEPYKFTQKERDRESGFHYFEARYLAGGISRFLSVDPKYANTDASAGDPQAMNLYAYVRNNPLRYADPTGLEPIPDLATIAHNAAVSDTRAATKSDAASFSAGLGDALLDMFTPNPYIYEGLLGGSRLGPDMRGALGINNVDTDSGSYVAGDVAGTVISFATGAGEARTALKGGTETAKALIKGGSVAGGEGANVAVRSAKSVIDPLAETAAGNARVVSKNAGTFASESGAVARVASANQAAAAQTMQNYQTILDSAQASLRHLVKSGVHPSKVMDMAFQQADAIYVSKYGLRPPGSL